MEAHGGDREGMDVSDHETSSSSETPVMVGNQITRSKSRGRGKVEQTLSLVITGVSLRRRKGKYL